MSSYGSNSDANMSNKRQRTTFRSTLGEFSVVANAAKIAAICEERDEALQKVTAMSGFLYQISKCDHGVDGRWDGSVE